MEGVNRGDIILTKTDNQFGRVISKYGHVYWTHVNMMLDDRYTPDICITHKDILPIEDIINRKEVRDYAILKSNADTGSLYLLDTFFQDAKYENLNGLYKVMRKLQAGRDDENVATDVNRYTCSSLLARVLGDRLPNEFHHSQFTPDDYFSYYREK